MPGDIPYKNAAKQVHYPQRVTQKIRAAYALGDQPSEQLGGWLGYFHQQDPTTFAKDNVLTYPSINCFIPFKDKVVPRAGTTLLGDPFTDDWGAVGHMKKYGTMSGIELELRVNKSTGAKRDIIYALCPDFINGVQQSTFSCKQITLNTNPLEVGVHEYYFDQWFDTDLNPAQGLNLSRAIWVNGNKKIYSWTGGLAPIVSIVPNISISTVPGTTWESQGFVDPAFDSSLNSTITINGVAYTVTGGWETDTLLLSTTAGIAINDIAFAEIQSVNTPLNITGTITHGAVTGGPFKNGELITGATSGAVGFMTLDGAGPGPMLLYGITPGPTGLFFQAGETITGIISNATTVVSSYTQTNSNRLTFDVCRNNLGYMYYGDWTQMKLYQSNQFGKDPTEDITSVQAVQNDLVVGTTPYTGIGQNVYRITIDSAVNNQTFISGGGGNLNDGLFNTAGYTGAPGVSNTYAMNIIADFTLGGNTFVGTPVIGDTLVGATSKAIGVITAIQPVFADFIYGLKMISNESFQTGETVNDANSAGGTGTHFVAGSAIYHNWFQYTKNGVVINTNTGFGAFPANIVITTPITLTDGLTFTFGNVTGHAVGDSFQLQINAGAGGVDTFSWQINGATPIAQHVPITGARQDLNDGVSISFISTTGHTKGDYWEITATQGVGGINPSDQNPPTYANFYYTVPTRIPGEGFIYQLTSNFWAMAPQEAHMYVCTNYGNWSYITTSVKAPSPTGTYEEILITPLKQVQASKPIYPYMMGYMDNDIIFVTVDKKLDLIGRMQLIQLPRIDNLSHPVQLDFDSVSFIGGSMEYQNKRLWINSPKERVMFCYDNHPENHYWQPPQMISENGLLSVRNVNGVDQLISHSQLRNQSWTLFSGKDGDNGSDYLVQARSPYLDKGNRWGSKSANSTFSEGYITGKPPMVQTLYKEVNGCGGIVPHAIVPVVCVADSNAPFGMGAFGSHPNGSDIFNSNNYFREVYPYQQTQNFYFAAIQMSCKTTNHSYEWLTFGINSVVGTRSNIDFKNKRQILPN